MRYHSFPSGYSHVIAVSSLILSEKKGFRRFVRADTRKIRIANLWGNVASWENSRPGGGERGIIYSQHRTQRGCGGDCKEGEAIFNRKGKGANTGKGVAITSQRERGMRIQGRRSRQKGRGAEQSYVGKSANGRTRPTSK